MLSLLFGRGTLIHSGIVVFFSRQYLIMEGHCECVGVKSQHSLEDILVF